MFDSEKVIIEVFEACKNVFDEHKRFNESQVLKHLNLPDATTDQERYWQQKNVTNSLNILEKAGFISGAIEPEYTPSIRLLKEVRYGEIAAKGQLFSWLPRCLKIFILFVILQKNKIISLMGVLAFAKLAHNAYLGLGLLAGWLEYVAIIIILYILYLLICKALDSHS